MSRQIAAYQLRPFDPTLADGPVADLIGGDLPAWETHTAYPLNADFHVCGPFAVVAVNPKAGATSVYWRGEFHLFDTANANDALRRFWNVSEFRPSGAAKAAR